MLLLWIPSGCDSLSFTRRCCASGDLSLPYGGEGCSVRVTVSCCSAGECLPASLRCGAVGPDARTRWCSGLLLLSLSLSLSLSAGCDLCFLGGRCLPICHRFIWRTFQSLPPDSPPPLSLSPSLPPSLPLSLSSSHREKAPSSLISQWDVYQSLLVDSLPSIRLSRRNVVKGDAENKYNNNNKNRPSMLLYIL